MTNVRIVSVSQEKNISTMLYKTDKVPYRKKI